MIEEIEIWKDIEGYEGYYQVSTLARIKGVSRIIEHGRTYKASIQEKILVQSIDSDGYCVVGLTKEGITKIKKVHRLVALTFISNPENKKQVNHKKTKRDNGVNDIEWATAGENIKDAWKRGLQKSTIKHKQNGKKGNPKIVLNTATGIFYDSAVEAAYYNEFLYHKLIGRLSGKFPNTSSMIYV